ncbi:MAG: methionyl-tRNA formyltransferase [Desulfobacterales bacterium]|uniref:Methionyl-tRNA formyltransferase n=1 Tax=Candidatus Desulfatibia vada TaxID=2841696 RepID=A0A8J6TPF7_9BACT|nr:methionyl-tRNA formyltransferase [Candidatus Desulfatibia vada]
MKSGIKIIFMGTPDFAVPALQALHKNNNNIALVITPPDRPKGRGRKVTPPPVKTVALKLGYDVVQPVSLKTGEFENLMKRQKPDMIIVVAFGQILSKNILEIPKLATINVHASLLPKYRGSAPIQWAVINGAKETGVTTMLMDEGMDTGDILLSSKTEITLNDTAGSLHDRLADLGADLLIQTLKTIENKGLNPTPQDHARATYAPLLKKNDGHLNWQMPAESLDTFIRGMTPWPGAFTFHMDKRLKIFKAGPIPMEVDELPGTVIKGFPDELRVSTGRGALSILEIQGASGKRLLTKDFLRGYNIAPGDVLT